MYFFPFLPSQFPLGWGQSNKKLSRKEEQGERLNSKNEKGNQIVLSGFSEWVHIMHPAHINYMVGLYAHITLETKYSATWHCCKLVMILLLVAVYDILVEWKSMGIIFFVCWVNNIDVVKWKRNKASNIDKWAVSWSKVALQSVQYTRRMG